MLSLDRIEENIAVCYDENNNKHEIDILFLPSDIKEGDIIKQVNGRFVIGKNETKKKREKIARLQEDLWK